MKCRQSEELFSDYIETTLPIPLRKDLEEHFESCPKCAALLASYRDVVEVLGSLPRPKPSPDLVDRILSATRSAFPARLQQRLGVTGFALPQRINWAVWAAAAAFVLLLFFRPPALLHDIGNRANRAGHQAYSYGLRVYRGSEQLIDELNVLRMTVGVAFEDRLDRLNERLKDLEEARRKSESTPESSNLTPSPMITDKNENTKLADPRSLS